MKKLFVVTLALGVIVVNLTQLSVAQTSALKSNNTNFLAEYDRLLDYYTHDINVSKTAFSGDGNVIFFSGKNADWWFVASSDDGDERIWIWLTLDKSWVVSNEPIPLHKGALFELPVTEVLKISSLPAGEYHFYFGIDTAMNGKIDPDLLYFDDVKVAVEAD